MSAATLPTDQPRAADLNPARDGTIRLFWIFAAGHVAVWMAVCLLTQPNPPLDMMEMVSWGNHLEWGYYKHPPMPAWIAWGSVELFGKTAWPLYLATQLTIVASMWAAWQLARRMLRPWPALCAALVLEASYFFSVIATNWNHNVTVRLFWALTVLFLYRAIVENRPRHWLAAGACLGLGMLSKYDIGALVLSMMAFSLLNRRVRPLLRTPGPYLMALVALVIFALHFWWICNHNFSTITYAMRRGELHEARWISHLLNPLEFLAVQLLGLPAMLLAASPLAGWFTRRSDGRTTTGNAADSRATGDSREMPAADRIFARDFLFAAVLGPAAVDLLVSLVTGAFMPALWGASLWAFVGVAIIFFFGSQGTPSQCRRAVVFCAVAGLLFAGGRAYGNLRRVHLAGKPAHMQFPGRELAAEVDRRWAKQSDRPLRIVAGPWWEAGNVSFFSPGATIVYGDMNTRECPWCDDEQLRCEGGVIVWPLDGEPKPPDLATRFPKAVELEPIVLHWQNAPNTPPIRIEMAIVRPAN